MKKHRIIIMLLCAAMLLSLAACGKESAAPEQTMDAEGAEITDANGSTVFLSRDAKVACGYASFAQCWLLSGGKLAGVTADAAEDRGLPVEDAAIIGTVKSIDLEKLAALEPDYVILSADLTAHSELKSALEELGIVAGYFREDSFEDYKNMMRQFCAVNGREDLYEQNVLAVEERMTAVRENIPDAEGQTALLIRAYSTGMRAKTDDNLAGQILKEYGLTNIADNNPSMLEELSMEQIILDDPDYIFVITMGDEQAALEYLESSTKDDPAWNSLTAVQEGRFYVLPQELFHYKPNERWDESYEYLAQIIFPESFE